MESQPISFTGRLSLEEAVDFHRYSSLRAVRPSIRWLIGGVVVLLAALMIVSLVFVALNYAVFVFLLVWVAVPFCWWYHDKYSVRSHYQRHPELYTENTVTITAVDVSLSNPNYSIRLNWNQFVFLIDTPKGLLLVVQPNQTLCFLPQRLFDGNNSKEAILAYASENNIPLRSMK